MSGVARSCRRTRSACCSAERRQQYRRRVSPRRAGRGRGVVSGRCATTPRRWSIARRIKRRSEMEDKLDVAALTRRAQELVTRERNFLDLTAQERLTRRIATEFLAVRDAERERCATLAGERSLKRA